MNRERRNHGSEFKREAVALVVEQSYSCAAAGRSLGVNGSLIGRWKRELESDAVDFLARVNAQPRSIVFASWKRRTAGCGWRKKYKKNHGLLCQGKLMGYRFIDEHKKAWPVLLMCDVLDVSRSGYYHWRGAPWDRVVAHS